MRGEIRTLFVSVVEQGEPVRIRLMGLLPDAADSVLVEVHPDLRVSALREHRGPEPSVDERAEPVNVHRLRDLVQRETDRRREARGG